MIEPVVKTIEVPCNQENAFNTFLKNFSSWWPLEHSVSGMNGKVAVSVALEPKLGGKITEVRFDGETEHWGKVVSFDPFSSFMMDFHMGLDASSATQVEVRFIVVDNAKTKVVLTHTNWEAFGEKAEQMRNGFNGGWISVFEEAYGNACALNQTI